MTPFGQNILLWRIHRNLTQKELADRSGITRPNLSAVERGKREVSLTTLRALASALDVMPGILVDGIGPVSGPRPSFSRQDLERIADAVWKGTSLPSNREAELAGFLRKLLHLQKNLTRGKRSFQRAWLQLRSAYSAEVIQTLVERVRDRQGLHGSEAN